MSAYELMRRAAIVEEAYRTMNQFVQGPLSLERARTQGVSRLVSVVIPAHNAEATLEETLRCACAQTYPLIEIIVVDDGSTDATAELARAQADADHRITVVRQPNGGVSSARNTGVALSSGEYLAFLDSDDLWHPTKLAKQVDALERAGLETALVYNWSCLIDDSGQILNSGEQEPIHGRVFGEFCRRDRIGNGSTAMIRRSAFLEVGGFDSTLHFAQDAKIHLQLAEKYCFALIPEELTGYRLHRGSACDNFDRAFAGNCRATESFRIAYPQYAPAIDLQRKELLQWFCSRALHNFRFGAALRMLLLLARWDAPFALYSSIFVLARPFLMMLNRTSKALPKFYTQTFNSG